MELMQQLLEVRHSGDGQGTPPSTSVTITACIATPPASPAATTLPATKLVSPRAAPHSAYLSRSTSALCHGSRGAANTPRAAARDGGSYASIAAAKSNRSLNSLKAASKVRQHLDSTHDSAHSGLSSGSSSTPCSEAVAPDSTRGGAGNTSAVQSLEAPTTVPSSRPVCCCCGTCLAAPAPGGRLSAQIAAVVVCHSLLVELVGAAVERAREGRTGLEVKAAVTQTSPRLAPLVGAGEPCGDGGHARMAVVAAGNTSGGGHKGGAAGAMGAGGGGGGDGEEEPASPPSCLCAVM